ncbi:hypothetical protein LTS12_003242 [Elasticomyces elasticus]|nr:hypothetical protein LTS12_003242 [Elasticomyces elasticus]
MNNPSPLYRLPAELRNEVLRMALTSDTPIELRPGNEPALLHTSSQTREETRLVYWAVNEFFITIRGGTSTSEPYQNIVDGINALDIHKFRAIPGIIVRYEAFRTRNHDHVPRHAFHQVLRALPAKGATYQQVVIESDIAPRSSLTSRSSNQSPPPPRTSTPLQAMDNSPFALLPAEIRNDIFRLALTSEVPIFFLPENEPGLLHTCRQIREETKQVHWVENEFILMVQSHRGARRPRQVLQDIQSLNIHKFRAIPKIIVRYEAWRPRPHMCEPPKPKFEMVLRALAAEGATYQQVVIDADIAPKHPAWVPGGELRQAQWNNMYNGGMEKKWAEMLTRDFEQWHESEVAIWWRR